jgi:hypothetical protein
VNTERSTLPRVCIQQPVTIKYNREENFEFAGVCRDFFLYTQSVIGEGGQFELTLTIPSEAATKPVRMQAPVLVRRFRGELDLSLVAAEILGLSKMNWNRFDYYSRLPASLESASAIARVGMYLSHFGSAPYDYRLLI